MLSFGETVSAETFVALNLENCLCSFFHQLSVVFCRYIVSLTDVNYYFNLFCLLQETLHRVYLVMEVRIICFKLKHAST